MRQQAKQASRYWWRPLRRPPKLLGESVTEAQVSTGLATGQAVALSCRGVTCSSGHRSKGDCPLKMPMLQEPCSSRSRDPAGQAAAAEVMAASVTDSPRCRAGRARDAATAATTVTPVRAPPGCSTGGRRRGGETWSCRQARPPSRYKSLLPAPLLLAPCSSGASSSEPLSAHPGLRCFSDRTRSKQGV